VRAGRFGQGQACGRMRPEKIAVEPALTRQNRSPTVRPPEGQGVRPQGPLSPRPPAARTPADDRGSVRDAPPDTPHRPIAPGNGSGSPPPWDLDRSGGLFYWRIGASVGRRCPRPVAGRSLEFPEGPLVVWSMRDLRGSRIREGVPVPQELAWLTSGGMDLEAQAASRERRPGGQSCSARRLPPPRAGLV
jgi:hypothetical protein